MSDKHKQAGMRGDDDDAKDANGGDHVDKEASAPAKRSAVRALIQDFSPVWFTWCMNSGILSLLIHVLPYQFNGQHQISTVLFVIDLVLFVICSILMLLRFGLYGKAAVKELALDVQELCFMGTWVISWMTLVSLTAVIVSNAYWGGKAFTIVAVVMWWIAVAWTMLTFLVIYLILTQKELTAAKNLSLAIILPAVATATTAVEGGLVAVYAFEISARLAVPMIVVSYLMLGIGLLVALLIYALWLQRLLVTGWFPGEKQPSLCLLLGPTGQSATGFLVLARASKMHFGAYNKGTFLQESSATALHGGSVLLALLVYGLGVFWLLFTVYGILDATVRRETKWTPAWYSTIFPTGTMNSALFLFSEEMDSPIFRVLATGLLIILILSYIFNILFTIRGIARGQVLIVREDYRLKKKS